MILQEIIDVIEEFAPLNLQESYDNAGLIVGNPKMKVTRALLCLDSTEEVINEAIEKGCNLVIAHHPIVFSGLKQFNGKNHIERTIIKAIKNDIAIYAAHTNLDNVKQGVNCKISEKLGLKNCSILSPKPNQLEIGAGMIGELEKPMSEAEFLKHLAQKMKTPLVKHTKLFGQPIKRVALCGGAGSFLLNDAIRQKADCFITGDYKYHQFFDAENELVIMDIGHYESEQFTVEVFSEILTNKFRNFALLFSGVNTNPVKYFVNG